MDFNNIVRSIARLDEDRNIISMKLKKKKGQGKVDREKDPHPTAFDYRYIDIATQTPTLILKSALIK